MMRITLALTFLSLWIGISAQNLEVVGKMVVKDINTIATFQSTTKNSFISLATNNDPLRSTSVGYFDNAPQEDPFQIQKYFFIDTPEGDFGEFRIFSPDGIVAIGTSSNLHATLNVGDHNTSRRAIKGESRDGYGVFGSSQNSRGLWGFSAHAEGVQGHGETFDFLASGSGTNYGSESSKRWKKNIHNLPNPLEMISSLRGVYFDWDQAHGGKHDIGFIAEEIGEIIPEIVVYEENGVDAIGMDYSKMSPLLVEAAIAMRREYQEKFDEQQSEIDQIRGQLDEIDALKQEIAELTMLVNAQVTPGVDKM